MISRLRRLIKTQLNRVKLPRSKASGFTLIELLVAMIISAIVLSALLSFMVDILRTDRREQAKSTSEQELQAALDYITRDLQQAVYIYDATGIGAIRSQLPEPSATDKAPVLVFWKREFLKDARAVSTGFDDQYVYSLVAYYLIKDPTGCQSTPWSCTARVGRFQIKDGVSTETGYLSGYQPDAGFRLFSVGSSDSISTAMNQWTKNGTYSTGIDTLVDFVDHTLATTAPSALNPVCPPNTQQIPQYSGSGGSVADDSLKTGSFYACVDSSRAVAKVYLRGNAFARTLNKSQMVNRAQYRQTLSPFFPSVSAQVQGRGLLGSN
jgi:prepilin-type N-terminal cleavage/methylation domain-containing protein